MSLPVGISTCNVTVGSALDFIGEDASVSVDITPILGGAAKTLIWAATGQAIVPFTSTYNGSAGLQVSFAVPHVNQTGFRDSGGNAFINWSYRAKVTVSVDATLVTQKQAATWTKDFQVVVGQVTVDLDLVPDGTVGVPGSSPMPAVTSVNGMTGAVVVDGGGGGGSGTVNAVNGHGPDGTGNVLLAAGDVGADANGAAAAALTAAQTYVNGRKVTDLTPPTALVAFGQRVSGLDPANPQEFVTKAWGQANLGGASSGGYPADWIDFDSFTGTDDQKMASCYALVGADTYKRTIKFRNRKHTFANTYPLNIRGLRFLGDAIIAREFRNVNEFACPSGGLFSVPTTASGIADFAISGMCFTGTGSWMVTTTEQLTDCDIVNCGFQGFASVANIKVTRCNFDRWYVNGATGTQLTLGGSDSTFFTSGQSYMSGQIALGLPYVQFGSMSQTKVGNIYITPTKGMSFKSTAGLDSEGLIWNDFLSTAFGQGDPTTSPQGAGIKLTGGTGTTFLGGRLFNMNGAKADKGWISCTGGIDHVFSDFVFVMAHNGFTSIDNDANTAAVYTTVPIRVHNPISSGGFPKRLRQATEGLITCNDPSWQIVTAA